MSRTAPAMAQLQFIWWGLADWRLASGRYEGGLAGIYIWFVRIGPLEIRRWRT